MKKIIKFINKNIMDRTSNKIGDSSTETITFKRISNGFKIIAPNGKKIKLINKPVETTNEQPKICKNCNINPTRLNDDLCECCGKYF